MNVYIVFSYDRYYPSGGWNDCDGVFNTEEEAEQYAKSVEDYDYVEIVNIGTGMRSRRTIKEPID